MLTDAVVIGFVVAWLRGGRLQEDFGGLRHMWLAPAALALQALGAWLLSPGLLLPTVTLLSYALLLYFAYANMANQGVRLVLIGILLNVAVMVANGGYIPVDVERGRSVGVTGIEKLAEGPNAKHRPMTEDSLLTFLGDVIPLPSPPFLFARVISIGDIFAVIGTFFLIQGLMGKPIKLGRA